MRWAGGAHPTHDPFPAHPALVGLYVGALRAAGLTKATILGRVAAIVYVHETLGASSPVLDPTVRRELRGLRRQADPDRQAREALERVAGDNYLGRMTTTILAG